MKKVSISKSTEGDRTYLPERRLWFDLTNEVTNRSGHTTFETVDGKEYTLSYLRA